jgi:hypothetical protein
MYKKSDLFARHTRLLLLRGCSSWSHRVRVVGARPDKPNPVTASLDFPD